MIYMLYSHNLFQKLKNESCFYKKNRVKMIFKIKNFFSHFFTICYLTKSNSMLIIFIFYFIFHQ